MRVLRAAVTAVGLGGCCFSGPPTDFTLRVLAGPDPAIVYVDDAMQASLLPYRAADLRVAAGPHEVRVDVDGRVTVVNVDSPAGTDVFVGGHDSLCFAIVENPGRPHAEPYWDLASPPPSHWHLVRLLKPGEVWPEGFELFAVAPHATEVSWRLAERLAAPIPCDAPDVDASITAAMVALQGTIDR